MLCKFHPFTPLLLGFCWLKEILLLKSYMSLKFYNFSNIYLSVVQTGWYLVFYVSFLFLLFYIYWLVCLFHPAVECVHWVFIFILVFFTSKRAIVFFFIMFTSFLRLLFLCWNYFLDILKTMFRSVFGSQKIDVKAQRFPLSPLPLNMYNLLNCQHHPSEWYISNQGWTYIRSYSPQVRSVHSMSFDKYMMRYSHHYYSIRNIFHCPKRPVLLPGKSHGWRSLVGCSPWGR